jgi:hypothetical protein
MLSDRLGRVGHPQMVSSVQPPCPPCLRGEGGAVGSVLRPSLAHQPLDQLNLAGVVKVVGGDAMDLFGIGPLPSGRA